MTTEAMRLLDELAAEGVSPWWAARPGEQPAVPEALSCGFRGVRMAAGTPVGVVRAACDELRSCGGFVAFGAAAFDGADDPAAWVAAARMLHSGVDRPNLLVGVPATPAGLTAVERCLAEGIGIEATSVFSVRQYRAVLDAQCAGLERARARGVDLAAPGAATSCDLGALDAAVNARLDRLGDDGAAGELRDTAGLATARLLYRTRETALASKRWLSLRESGARPLMLLWSGLRPEQVRSLVSWNTGHVLSAETVEAAARGHGLEGDTLLGRHEQSVQALRLLAERGVDVEAVGAELLRARSVSWSRAR
ncbi:transaldolase family protein [Streptomyces sp. S.PB5]|uniref:transaldolase family protein n=1 Tax=Streptomyces sp. S.PB5 TaxID=3020844 RepID=UPI0025B01E15|nr:transaldolase family protein [Streptomyces sp. S.PB5]MDN3026463.1 transaldolase family protein [Streptomyces sp. S.PB5]